MSPPVTLSSPPEGGVAELHLVPPDASLALFGEIDLANVTEVTFSLEAVLATPVRELRVDLHEVDFASVGALSALVDAAHAMMGREGRITLTGVRPLHRRVLQLLGAPVEVIVLDTTDPAEG